MTATAFDTLKAAKALQDAGFDDTQAEAVVVTVGGAVREHTAALADSVATVAGNMATKERLDAIASTMATNERLDAIAGTMATNERLDAIAGTMATNERLDAVAGTMATNERLDTVVEQMATKEYVGAAIAELRAEIAVEFKNLYRYLWVMGTSIVGVTVVLIKLLP